MNSFPPISDGDEIETSPPGTAGGHERPFFVHTTWQDAGETPTSELFPITSGRWSYRSSFTPRSSQVFSLKPAPFAAEVFGHQSTVTMVGFMLAAQQAALIHHIASQRLVDAAIFHEGQELMLVDLP